MFNLYEILSNFEKELNKESVLIRQKAMTGDKEALIRAYDLCTISSDFSMVCQSMDLNGISQSVDNDMKGGQQEEPEVRLEKFVHLRDSIQNAKNKVLGLPGDWTERVVFEDEDELRSFYSVEDLQEAASVSIGVAKYFFLIGSPNKVYIDRSIGWLHLLRHIASRHDLPDETIRKAEEALPWITAYHANLQRNETAVMVNAPASDSFYAPFYPLPAESALPDIGNELMLWFCRLMERSACRFRDLTADGAEDEDNPHHEEWAESLRRLIDLEFVGLTWTHLHTDMQKPLGRVIYGDCLIYGGDNPEGAFKHPCILERIEDQEYLSVIRKVAETFSTCRSLWYPYGETAASMGLLH